jgi:ribosomal protein S18 acetylase RimI-like enzyme
VEITVRPAQNGDAEAIGTINLASWEAAYRGIVADAFLDSATVEGRIVRWRERIATGTSPILVAESDGALRGYCSLVLRARDDDGDAVTGEIGAIYVAPASFRSGVGSAMVTGALDLMREQGFDTATLWVLCANLRARSFYARQGFVSDGAVRWLDLLEAEEMRLRRAL